jgi:hypothetical protein
MKLILFLQFNAKGFLVKKLFFNGRESAINRALDGSTYPSLKLVALLLIAKQFF